MSQNVNKMHFKHLGNPVFQHFKSDQQINVPRQHYQLKLQIGAGAEASGARTGTLGSHHGCWLSRDCSINVPKHHRPHVFAIPFEKHRAVRHFDPQTIMRPTNG